MGATERESASALPIEDAADLLLLLLYAPGRSRRFCEPIVGATRLQKLMFLLRQGVGPSALVTAAKDLGYKAYKMGPFSDQLRDTLQDLTAAGIIDIGRLEYTLPDDADALRSEPSELGDRAGMKRVESFSYSLSEDLGARIGKDLWAALSPRLQSELTEFKSFFNHISLRQLLIFTYEKFPDYTEQSTIKDQLSR